MNIVVLASVGCKNLWDELILQNTISVFWKKYISKKPIFQVFSYDPKHTFFKAKNIKYYEYFPIGTKKLKNIFKNIKNFRSFIQLIKKADIVIIWWWGLFFDSEWSVSTLRNLNSWIFRTKIIQKYKKKTVFYGIWINFKDAENNIYASKIKKIFSKSNEIYVRDTFSQKYLTSLWVHSKVIQDPVYNDNGQYIESKSLELWAERIENFSKTNIDPIELKNKTVWLALRKLNYPEYEQQIVELLEYLIQKQVKIVLIPLSFHQLSKESNDYIFFLYIIKKYFYLDIKNIKHKNIYICSSMQESYRQYKDKKVDIVFASRLHSIILSRVYKIPYYALSYGRKTDEQLKKSFN